MLIWLLAALAGTGWRGDGTNTWPDAVPVPPASPRWTAPMPGWGNASPVALGGLVCATAEPTSVVCVDAATGALRWQATHEVVDALPAAEQPAARARLAAADGLAEQVRAAQQRYSDLLRETRRAGADPALTARLAAASSELGRLKAELEATAAWRTPPDKEIIGYASPTPATDGRALYVVTGHGVVSRYEVGGARSWIRWLGPHDVKMRGYDVGSTASPVLADGKLIVAYGRLRGLDPATGATVWEGPVYTDYGTPAVVDVGGLVVLVTPDGRVVRARDGVELSTGLMDVWYVGPVAVGSDLYVVGGRSTGHQAVAGGALAASWRLERAGDGVRITPRWRVSVPTRMTFYAAPVVHGGLVYAVTNRSVLHVLDAGTGAAVYEQDLAEVIGPETYASPVVAGGKVVLVGSGGKVAVLRAGRSFVLEGTGGGGTVRASPVVAGGRLVVRSYEALTAY